MSDDSSNRVKPTSVMAFLFLPQFSHMFRSSSHLVPIFMRTIAHLFVQVGLIPPTHPSAFYGDPGVEKRGFFAMMGDAWHMLRATKASAYQWSVFCCVILMIIVFMTSVSSVLFNFSAGAINTAHAQVFTSQMGNTDIKNMPAPQSPCTGQTPLCRLIPTEGTAYGDYGIDLLDKMLRLGANQTGGPLQNAVGALMQVYNTGILFVAACLLFWLIISVVVDIAKTGQVGGGRHNLVWAPIRIVFALGMMIPLGSSGFSSGQFVVMKIAEWGSNFGTNGWNAYLNKVISNSNVVPTLGMGPDLMPLVGTYEQLWVCKTAHNGNGYQSEGQNFMTPTDANGFSDQEIAIRPDTNATDNGEMSYAYSNTTGDAICGRVTFPTGNNPSLQALINPSSGNTVDPVAQKQAQFEIALDQAWMSLFVAGYTAGGSPSSMTDQGLPLATIARNFACGFVAQHIWGQTDGKDDLYIDCAASPAPQCGSGAGGSGKYPDMSCIDTPSSENSTSTLTGLIGSTITTVAQNEVNQLKTIPATALFGQRGWADMGSFYKTLTTLTTTVKGSLAIPVKITAPGAPDGNDNQSAKVAEVLGKYNDWWNTVPNGQQGPTPPSSACSTDPIPQGCSTRVHDGNGGFMSGVLSGFKSAVGGLKGIGKAILGADAGMAKMAVEMAGFAADPASALFKQIQSKMRKDQKATFLGIPDPHDAAHVNDYPLQMLSSIGYTMVSIATDIALAITIVEIVAALAPGWNFGGTIDDSMLVQLLTVLNDIFMGCGFMLLYYLPLMPYIRVAQAVLVWMIAVFEAVMLVPIACLSFLDTEKEGMYAKHPFINWLDILVRPILTVCGYVGAILVFDAFFGYLQDSFANTVAAETSDMGTIEHFIAFFANSVIFSVITYTAANASFKMISMIPDAFFRWMPGGQASGATGAVGDFAQAASGAAQQVGKTAGGLGSAYGTSKAQNRRAVLNYKDNKPKDPGDDTKQIDGPNAPPSTTQGQ
jgi:conjugal transfer/type IV secretion protein DotA/TraY